MMKMMMMDENLINAANAIIDNKKGTEKEHLGDKIIKKIHVIQVGSQAGKPKIYNEKKICQFFVMFSLFKIGEN